MISSEALFWLKYFLLLTFVFLVALTISFVLKNMKVRQQQDKRLLQNLFLIAVSLGAGFLLYWLFWLTGKLVLVLAVAALGGILAYGLFILLKNSVLEQLILSFNLDLEPGQLLVYNDQIVRFLAQNKGKLFLENLDGQVLQLPGDEQQRLEPVDDKVWFYLPSEVDLDLLWQKIRENPFVDWQKIAVLTEQMLPSEQNRLKICIKNPSSFKQVSNLKKYLESLLF